MSERPRRNCTEDDCEHHGTVEAVLPRGMFQVRLDSGKVIRTSLGAPARHAIVRLISGDRVSVQLSSVDPTRGQVTKKL